MGVFGRVVADYATSNTKELAHVRGLQPVGVALLVLAVAAAAFMVRSGLRRVGVVAAGFESSALRDESPALANLLIHSTGVTRAAIVATLIDLAGHGVTEVVEVPPGRYAL